MKIEPAASLRGHIAVPGDKSISHRAVLLGAIGDGETAVRGFGRSGDTEATIAAVRALGVTVDEDDVDSLRIHGVGLRGLREPDAPIDCGNSGTTLRLLAGILAGQQGRFELTGDESLRRRPVDRIAAPLAEMGATVESADGTPPLAIEGGELRGIRYELPVASAQVKSCVLLAGLYAAGQTTVVEPLPTRDHTELMLEAAGVRVTRKQRRVSVGPAEHLRLGEVDVPGDFSAAAPFIVAATLLPGSELTIHDVGVNPRRTGLLDVLARMGARITVFNRHKSAGEPVGDLDVRCRRADRDHRDRRGGAADGRRAAAVRARRRNRARGEPRRRRTGAARQGNGPHRNRDDFASRPWHPRHGERRWPRGERGTFPP